MPTVNTPGEALFKWILGKFQRQRVAEDTWISLMARQFAIDPILLENYLMRSTSLMILRRLLWNADWYKDRFVDDEVVIQRFEQDYLLGVFNFERSERRHISGLVFDALRARNTPIPNWLQKKMRDRAARRDEPCSLCGRTIDYNLTDPDSEYRFSLDHIWPQSLGGLSNEDNLRVAHNKCNSRRKNIVEASDTHYEHFFVKTDWSPPESQTSFWKELNHDFRMAALLQSNFTCQICDAHVADMDRGVDYTRINKDENYHMFNIRITCRAHRADE